LVVVVVWGGQSGCCLLFFALLLRKWINIWSSREEDSIIMDQNQRCDNSEQKQLNPHHHTSLPAIQFS
jgi:hypothetical protein